MEKTAKSKLETFLTITVLQNNTPGGASFIKAEDLIVEELRLRFHQDGVKTGSRCSSWQTKINNSLNLFADVLGDSPLLGQHRATKSIHKRTLTKLKASSNLACLPQQRQRCPLFGENIKTWLRTSMSHRRRTHLALTHVHGDVLDKSHSRITTHPPQLENSLRFQIKLFFVNSTAFFSCTPLSTTSDTCTACYSTT